MINLEHYEQKSLIKICDMRGYPYNLIFAIPNGGHRHKAVAQKLKSEGVRAGVLDLLLPYPHKGYAGLFVEMKSKKGKLTELQGQWLDIFLYLGYSAEVCYGCEEAIKTIDNYLI